MHGQISGLRLREARALHGSLRDTRPLSRRELLLWLACILLANHIFFVEPVQSAPQIIEALPQLATKSIFFYLAWFVVFQLLAGTPSERPASRLDLAIGFAVCLVNFMPGKMSAGIPVTILAAYLLASSGGDERIKAAAAVLLGLALNGLWGPKVLELFAYYLVRVDAALVGVALMLTHSDIVWNDNIVGVANGHRIIVYASCSSLHNISLGLLCWVSLKSLVRSYWLRSDVWIGLLVCVVVVALNVGRLYLTALSPEQYAYWHEGSGQEVFVWVTTLVVLSISLWGAYRIRPAS
jgi:exosortase/archaeosortase family protein